MYFANKKGTRYTGKICNPRTKPYTADELARQAKFANTITAMKALTAEQKAAYQVAFINQTKYRYLNGYIFAQEYAKISWDLTIDILYLRFDILN